MNLYRSIKSPFIVLPTDSTKTRRKKLLNLFLLTVGTGIFGALIALIVATPLGKAGTSQEVALLYGGIIIALVGVVILYLINRYFSGDLASVLFLVLVLSIAIISDEPYQVVNGRGLLVFAIPIVSASVLLRPWVSFLMAGVSSLTIIFMAMSEPGLSPNVIAMLGFFVLAMVSWVSSRILETSLQYSRMTGQKLEAERQKVQKYLDIAGVILIVLDKDSNVQLINKKGCEILGYAEEEILGRNWFDTFLPESIRKDVSPVFQNLFEGKMTISEYYENPILTSSGEERIIAWHNTIITDGKGTIDGTLSSGEDITDQKQDREELKKYSEKLEQMVEERTRELHEAQEELVRKEKLAILGELAGGIGHELRNPLGALKNAAYFLKMALDTPDPEVMETLDILEKEVATSERIITSLLDFARPRKPIRAKTPLITVIKDALSRISIPDTVTVVTHMNRALPPLSIDPQQLTQVFENLVLNGVQAMPEGGVLTVSSDLNHGTVVVSVADTGEGFSKETQEKLFEPLFTTKVRGIGLGLAISKTLVEAHGGTIEAASIPGEGSTFTVILPTEVVEK